MTGCLRVLTYGFPWWRVYPERFFRLVTIPSHTVSVATLINNGYMKLSLMWLWASRRSASHSPNAAFHKKRSQRDAHLPSSDIFIEHAILLANLDKQLSRLTRKGIGFPDHPSLESAVGISGTWRVAQPSRPGLRFAMVGLGGRFCWSVAFQGLWPFLGFYLKRGELSSEDLAGFPAPL